MFYKVSNLKMSKEIQKTLPWKNGFYRMKSMPSLILTVTGENVTIEGVSGRPTNFDDDPNAKGTWKYGDFGDASEDVAKAAGKPKYNVDINLWQGALGGKGIVSDDGKKITFFGVSNAVDSFEWESDEAIIALKETGDPVDCPPSDYKIQPENQGLFLFISGAPGLGKSTTGHLLSKKAGFVYYEGDCFWLNLNPYVPADAKEPTLAAMAQNFLKGVPQARLDACAGAEQDFEALTEGKLCDQKKLLDLYSIMAKDIGKERRRMGGDWAVAQAVPTRILRDHIRRELGPDLVFVVLHMTKEDQERRIKARHGEGSEGLNDYLFKAYNIYEPAAEDEPMTLDVRVTPDMTPDDVVNKILQCLKNKN